MENNTKKRIRTGFLTQTMDRCMKSVYTVDTRNEWQIRGIVYGR